MVPAARHDGLGRAVGSGVLPEAVWAGPEAVWAGPEAVYCETSGAGAHLSGAGRPA